MPETMTPIALSAATAPASIRPDRDKTCTARGLTHLTPEGGHRVPRSQIARGQDLSGATVRNDRGRSFSTSGDAR